MMIIKEFNYVYNMSFEISSIVHKEILTIPLRNMIYVRGGKIVKKRKKKYKK